MKGEESKELSEALEKLLLCLDVHQHEIADLFAGEVSVAIVIQHLPETEDAPCVFGGDSVELTIKRLQRLLAKSHETYTREDFRAEPTRKRRGH